MESLPIIDISELINPNGNRQLVADQIHHACLTNGFLCIKNHGISLELQDKLELISKQFFALDHKTKMQIHMSKAGKAWRGFFPLGEELTSGQPDMKEGIYFGEELPNYHPKVQAGIPMHGSNLFPDGISEMKTVVLNYIQDMTNLGHVLMRGLSMSLGLNESYFHDHYTSNPFILFRIFHYPAMSNDNSSNDLWGVGEHTDYGVLTILKQDEHGGLQVKSRGKWMDVPPVKNTFICNLGDMLERMTKGLYRSTPHRVLNTSGNDRLSWPFFFDPGFDVNVQPLPFENVKVSNNANNRWDEQNIHKFNGTYGDYILHKVSKVFPGLKK